VSPPSLNCIGPEITIVKLPTAEPVAFLGTILSLVAEAEPTPEPVPDFAAIANFVAEDEPTPDPEPVCWCMGAPK
jgi:hypothetical protein